ncbi:hypothetical protein ACFLRC_03690 [Candidatus Altiarchaeota archaeon]
MGEIYHDQERKEYILVSGDSSLTVTEKEFQDLKKGQSTLFYHLRKEEIEEKT